MHEMPAVKNERVGGRFLQGRAPTSIDATTCNGDLRLRRGGRDTSMRALFGDPKIKRSQYFYLSKRILFRDFFFDR